MEWKQVPVATFPMLRAEPIPGLKLTITEHNNEGFFQIMSGLTMIKREIPTIEEAKQIAIEFVVHEMVNFLREHIEINEELEYDPTRDYSEMYRRGWKSRQRVLEEIARNWRLNAR